MDKISEKIKAARIAKGVTIEEVAEATLLSEIGRASCRERV